MPGANLDSDFDPQDQAETRDETFLDEAEEVSEMRTFEELPDLLDVTQLQGDRDEDEALALDADEFDEDAFDDEDLEEDDELHYRAATRDDDDFYDDGKLSATEYDDDEIEDSDIIEGLNEEVADADLVTGGEDDFTNFQSKNVADEDLERMGYLDPARRDAD